MIRIYSIALFVLLSLSISAQINEEFSKPKKQLSAEVYPDWKNISGHQISNDGKWVSYAIKPQKGDGFLYLYNIETKTLDSIARGTRAIIDPTSSYLAFRITPQYDTLRKMKLDKVPRKKLPKDTLGIWIFANDSIIKIKDLKRFTLAEEESNWMVYSLNNPIKKPRKVEEKKKFKLFNKKKKVTPTKRPIKQKGDYVVIYNPLENKKKAFRNISDYDFSHFGSSVGLISNIKKDSTTEAFIRVFNTREQTITTILETEGTATSITLDRKGGQTSFLFAADTAKENKIYGLYYWFEGDSVAQIIVDTASTGMIKGWSPSVNNQPHFSKNGARIYFGTAAKPVQEVKDTLLPEEKYHVDVWNHKDPQLQPQQKLMARREAKRTYLAVWHRNTKSMKQLADTSLPAVYTSQEGNGKFALGSEDEKYQPEQSWDGWYSDYYVVNTISGTREIILEHHGGYVNLSTDGTYLLYYKRTDSAWYSYDISARQHIALTKDLKVNFYDEEYDMPQLPNAYGVAGWYTKDKYVVLKDKYDLWRIDPTMKTAPVNLTKSYGRENKITFKPITLDRENKYFNDENPRLLNATNEVTKQSGFYSIDVNGAEGPAELIMTDHRYYYPLKPKDADNLIWRRSSFTEYYNLFSSTSDFRNIEQITDVNPQQADYNWGTVELVKWDAFDGQELSGLLYKPENFDSTLRYPVIVYFYERFSDDIHNHYIPKPSHSTINFSEYVSNGYIVFVPDITYQTGHPAKSAYNAIVSGTEFIKKNEWVDSERIGIQGQSWGGYQVAMLVTQTDIYACAESGAPVSNMISAYGGIRWGSGMSRAFQYEKGQSRIGVSPWENIDLYIENSPIFFADKVNTPLLIMHNDKDGAVPWYQGIEYFTNLRRLDKEVWMLTYNNDGHNLMKWPNRVDLSIRMMQFFNHYLKGEPMPVWMSKGIPATKKGKTDGYKLDKK